MKILIIQASDKHTEVAGFLIEYHKNDIIYIYHPFESPYNCFPYYEKIFNKSLIKINKIIDKYDIIYFLTANDVNKFCNLFGKIITIPHTVKSLTEFINLPLTPLINEIYCLPIYNYPNINKRLNEISIIGLTFHKHKNMKDLLFLINQKKFKINIFTREFDNLISLDQTNLYINCPTEKMISIIRQSKFIAILDHEKSWYHQDRLTGSIPLGYNNEIPLILTKKLNDLYELSGNITYKKSIKEVWDMINNNKYYDLIKNMRECKNKIIEKNHKILSEIII